MKIPIEALEVGMIVRIMDSPNDFVFQPTHLVISRVHVPATPEDGRVGYPAFDEFALAPLRGSDVISDETKTFHTSEILNKVHRHFDLVNFATVETKWHLVPDDERARLMGDIIKAQLSKTIKGMREKLNKGEQEILDELLKLQADK